MSAQPIDPRALKACPFCGNQPVTVFDANFNSVSCQTGACVNPSTGSWLTREEAIKAWNARAIIQSHFAESVNRLEVWRVAITLANNICVQESDRINSEDGSLEAVNALSDCAKRIRGWLEPENSQLDEMLKEAGVKTLPPSMADELAEALRPFSQMMEDVRRVRPDLEFASIKHAEELLTRYDAQKGQS